MRGSPKKRTLLILLACACIFALCASGAAIAATLKRMWEADAAEKEAVMTSASETAPTPTQTQMPEPAPTVQPTPIPTPEPTPEPYVPPAELTESIERNPDVIAWLEIPGTAVSYPVLQEPEIDNYYLNITIDGGEGYPGSIYTNSMEGREFDTFNTVIYGHNMRNGTYFGSLKYYRDPAYLDAHREIRIYTLTQKRVYDIFAVVDYDNRYITDCYQDENREDRIAFLKSLQDFGAEFFGDRPVGPDSRIITLSTCVGDETIRFLVLAAEREVQTEQSKES